MARDSLTSLAAAMTSILRGNTDKLSCDGHFAGLSLSAQAGDRERPSEALEIVASREGHQAAYGLLPIHSTPHP